MIEILRSHAPVTFRFAVLDFDGTLSLIREGWQGIMIPYFAGELQKTPLGAERPEQALVAQAEEFIARLTGKQTIYQCIALAEEFEKLGGRPLDPQEYKDEYNARVLRHIEQRLEGLRSGRIQPEELLVPGSVALLELLKARGVKLYLASGTDEEYVQNEAALLGLVPYFEAHIYGAQRDYQNFSKKMVIERILKENQLPGEQVLGFGDGYVEIENIKAVGGVAIGVASNEAVRNGTVDAWKRERLIRAGADAIVPDYTELDEMDAFLFS